jgi:hypothetical protein
MGEMVIFSDGEAIIMGGELDELQEIVIYCELCNEPVAITPEFNDKVFLTCMRCHAVSHIKLQTSKEVDDSTS